MTLRDLSKCNGPNDGTRTLIESTLISEVVHALKAWSTATDFEPLLIGGLAVSYYVKPRTTTDIDLLFLSHAEIPLSVEGFKRTRGHAFTHKATGVEVEVLDPEYLKVPEQVVKIAYAGSTAVNGFRIPSRASLIQLKLFRFNMQDQADIAALLKCNSTLVDVDTLYLPARESERYQDLCARLAKMET